MLFPYLCVGFCDYIHMHVPCLLFLSMECCFLTCVVVSVTIQRIFACVCSVATLCITRCIYIVCMFYGSTN